MAEGMVVFWTLWETSKSNNSKSLSTTGSRGAMTSSRPSYEYELSEDGICHGIGRDGLGLDAYLYTINQVEKCRFQRFIPSP